MLQNDARIFASFHPDDESLAQAALEIIKAAGWRNIATPVNRADKSGVSESIRQSDLFAAFLSKAYARDDGLMLGEFAYAAAVVRKPFLPVWLDSLADIRQANETPHATLSGVEREKGGQLISALEMLTAKHPGTTAEGLGAALAAFTPDTPPYTPSSAQVCEKPCEAYEGDEPYIFISYAHDDAERVYPIVKELYESGWDLWYDEGIKTTERYLPVIADNLRRGAVVVLMLTNRCLERPFVINYELAYARKLAIPVVPVLLEELSPPPWMRETADSLLETAIARESLLERLGTAGLPNRGTRAAVPPAVRQNVIYDVILPPELPGFKIAVQGDEVSILKYVGEETEVVIPSVIPVPDADMTFRITGIGKQAFYRRASLTRVTIPETVTDVGVGAFYDCRSLTDINIAEGVTKIGDGAFLCCASLTDVTIPESVRSIGNNAFMNCSSLTHIAIPEGVTSIGQKAFYGCSSLASVTIPKSVTSIGKDVFSGCASLESGAIPEST